MVRLGDMNQVVIAVVDTDNKLYIVTSMVQDTYLDPNFMVRLPTKIIHSFSRCKHFTARQCIPVKGTLSFRFF